MIGRSSTYNLGSLEDCKALFESKGKRKRIKLFSNTFLEAGPDQESFEVWFYDTRIITYTSGGILLNCGTSHLTKTRTTKIRMNQVIPNGFRVVQEDWKWKVYRPWLAELQHIDKDMLYSPFTEEGTCFLSRKEMALSRLLR